jgi:protein-S-isoprenylcysteine O-methyltransferase Ste14
MGKYQSHAGYFGAIATVIMTFSFVYLKAIGSISTVTSSLMFSIVGVTFIVMIVSEYFLKRRYNRRNYIVVKYESLNNSNFYILKSSLIRFSVLFIPFLISYLLVNNHEYFIKGTLFKPTREFFDYLLYIFLIFGLPYSFITLKFRGSKKYEFGDYALLTIVGIKSFIKSLFVDGYKKKFHKNRRVKKVWLLYLVNFFFLTLMARFVVSEFQGFERELFKITSDSFSGYSWYNQFKTWFLVIFHLIFTIDVSIAIIGYSFASRWIGNRTRSVDATMSGWVVALLCYPPLNSAFTNQFIGYYGMDTHQLITNEYALAFILTLVIIFYMIYVWATVALGFKFSNLTNRGVVDIGPYKYVRHPAYISKNFSWWLDNTFVLTNIWASVGLAMWNVIYILRALTEERHLKIDKDYKEYIKKVKYRFIPKVI